MDANILRKVKESLKAKFYVMNDVWLNECVDYYLGDHHTPTPNEVLEFVVSQWQLSDLREISNEKPCLPKNLAQEKCTTLRGHFVLQMEKVYDIAESKYKQLQRIQKVSDENVRATEDEKTQPWEPKKKRMLYLHLTDGSQDITAMEYKPIRFLNDNLLPGYKLLIKGPVTCRRGVILLDETNVAEMGGEVEKLLIPNALENVMARALNLPENPDPYNDDNQNEVRTVEDVVFDDDFDIDFEDIELIEREMQNAQTTERASSNAVSVRPANVVISDRQQREVPDPVPLDEQTESDLLFDMIDDNVFIDSTENLAKSSSDRTTSHRKTLNRTVPQKIEFSSEQDDFAAVIEPNIFRKITERQPHAIVTSSGTNSEESSLHRVNVNANKILLVSNIETSKVQANSPKILSPVAETSSSPLSFERKPIATTSQSSKANDKKKMSVKPTEIGSKRTASALSPPASHPPAEKVRCTQDTPKVNKLNRKITDFLIKDEPMESEPSLQKMCDRICEVLTISVSDKPVRKTIKAKITNIQKVGKNGQSWELDATLSDGTGSLDVMFASEVIESLLGLSVAEFLKQKKIGKTNQEVTNELRQRFRSAESKLLKYEDCFEIELTSGKKPTVTELKKLANEQKKTPIITL